MPGDFLILELQTPCGSNPDGSTIYCTEIDYLKVPFTVEARDEGGWQDPESGIIYRPLSNLVASLERYGIEVTYDEEDLVRRVGPSSESYSSDPKGSEDAAVRTTST